MNPALLHRDESRCRPGFESLVEESTLEAPSVTIGHEDGVEIYPKSDRGYEMRRVL